MMMIRMATMLKVVLQSVEEDRPFLPYSAAGQTH
jgi:hypothetical protein